MRIPPSIIDDVIKNGDELVIGTVKRYNKGIIFVYTEANKLVVRSIKYNRITSISDLVSQPNKIFGYLDTELRDILLAEGWVQGSYTGTSNAIVYEKYINGSNNQIVFNYGGGIHSSGSQFSKPYYYKLEGQYFKPHANAPNTRVIDEKTYPDLQKALNLENFRLIDGPTGKVLKK